MLKTYLWSAHIGKSGNSGSHGGSKSWNRERNEQHWGGCIGCRYLGIRRGTRVLNVGFGFVATASSNNNLSRLNHCFCRLRLHSNLNRYLHSLSGIRSRPDIGIALITNGTDRILLWLILGLPNGARIDADKAVAHKCWWRSQGNG